MKQHIDTSSRISATGQPAGETVHVPEKVRRRTSFRQRAALALCAAVLLGLVVTYASAITSGTIVPRRADFITYYSAATLVTRGRTADVYSFSRLAAVERVVVRPYSLRYGVLPYVYPPYFALALAPLSQLPYDGAYALWLILGVLVLGSTLMALQRYAALRWWEAGALWLAAFSFLPVFVALAQGQVSVVLLGLITLAFFAARAGRDEIAGAALAICMIKAPYILPIALVFLVARRWRALAAFAGASLVLFALPILFLGAAPLQGYVHVLRLAGTWHSQYGYGPEISNSFSSQAHRLLPDGPATLLTFVLDLIALAAVIVVTARSKNLDLPLALAVVVGLLISPHVLPHDLCLLLLPVGIAVAQRNRAPHLGGLLTLGYGAILLGLVLSLDIRLQLSVLAMVALGYWLWRASTTPISGNGGVDAHSDVRLAGYAG